jgi:hypothetical protein
MKKKTAKKTAKKRSIMPASAVEVQRLRTRVLAIERFVLNEKTILEALHRYVHGPAADATADAMPNRPSKA